jgi:hypothetical protein
MGNPGAIETTLRIAAMRQIHAAIEHWRRGDFECAITLAGAGEGMIPVPAHFQYDEPVTSHAAMAFHDRWERVDAEGEWLRGGTKWMRESGSESVEIAELDVLAAIDRAIARFQAAYDDQSPQMCSFRNCLCRTLLDTCSDAQACAEIQVNRG